MGALTRRQLLSATLFSAMAGRRAMAQVGNAPPVFWVQLHATGGWDQMLFCDPKFGPRTSANGGFHNTNQLAMAGSIPYVDAYSMGTPMVRPVGPFFTQFANRLTVINGIDVGSNNHDVGARFSMSGSLLEGFPIFAAQVAGALGRGRVMPLVDISGYDESGGLTAPVRLDYRGVPEIVALQNVVKPSSGQYLNNQPTVTAMRLMSQPVHTKVRALALSRAERLQQSQRLPGWQRGLTAWREAMTASPELARLSIPPIGSDQLANTKALATMGLRGFKAGVAMSMTIAVGGPNMDSHGIPDADHLVELGLVFEVARHLLLTADMEMVPTVVVMTSDFGRTPVRETAGSGHWPIGSTLLAQSQAALALNLFPAGRVIGGTTGSPMGPNPLATVLRARKIDPTTHAFSDTGVTLTPTHVIRALRQVAGIQTSEALRSYPLNVDGTPFSLTG
ncbi:MAG: hypothetical protein Q8L14_32530 [Myxococcales bacterium]|nr:hypothetical protein [Myxococcales bacterium]